MKLGDIKIEALKLMFASYSNSMTITDMDDLYSNEDYADYLYAMNGSIDRAIDRIKAERLQTKKTLVLTGGTVGTYRTAYDLSAITDYYAVDRVIYEDTNGTYEERIDYIIENDSLLLDNIDTSGEYRLIYYAEVDSATTMLDTAELSLKNDVARLIPYFIKGELFQEREPNLASESRNLFEQMLSALKIRSDNTQTKVKSVYYYD